MEPKKSDTPAVWGDPRKQFYVMDYSTGNVTVRVWTEETARASAEQLAKLNPGREFIIMRPVCIVQNATIQVTTVQITELA